MSFLLHLTYLDGSINPNMNASDGGGKPEHLAGNPQEHKENMQTHHKKNLERLEFEPQIFLL